MQFGKSDGVSVQVETSVRITADVEYSGGQTGTKNREFKGLNITVTNTTESSSLKMTATGEASLKFNGKDYSTHLSPVKANIHKGEGQAYSQGNIKIAETELRGQKVSPVVNVIGSFWNIKEDGSGATPLVVPGTPIPRNYKHLVSPSIKPSLPFSRENSRIIDN